MADYYSALTRKLQQIHDDPAKAREVVYEAARLALRWQVHEQSSTMSLVETKRHILDLEDAIVRLEAEAAGKGQVGADEAPVPANESSAAAIEPESDDAQADPVRDDQAEPLRAEPLEAEPGQAALPQSGPAQIGNGHDADADADEPPQVAAHEAPEIAGPAPTLGAANDVRSRVADLTMADLRGSRRSRDRPIDLDRAVDLGRPIDLDRPIEAGRPIDLDRAVDLDESAAASTGGPVRPQPAQERRPPGPGRVREPLSAPRRPGYLVNPADFVNPEVAQRMAAGSPVNGRSGLPFAMSVLMIALQLVVAGVAIAALLVALSGRNGPSQTASDAAPPAAARSNATATAPSGYTMAGGTPRAAAPPKPAAPAATPTSPTDVMPAAVAPTTVAPTTVTPTTVTAGGASFQRPPAYGVYAIDNNRLTALAQVPTTPIDPRTSSQLKITEPGRTNLPRGQPAFVVFRRDLPSNPLEKVPLRIAARVAHAMNFDSTGRAVMTTPATETWIIRDQGYELRVSPVDGETDMVRLTPENPALSLPAGRYELMLGEQAYDFVIPGEVTDPAHCVEGVTTVRGQVYNECKPVL